MEVALGKVSGDHWSPRSRAKFLSTGYITLGNQPVI